jgi:hypothetical protein
MEFLLDVGSWTLKVERSSLTLQPHQGSTEGLLARKPDPATKGQLNNKSRPEIRVRSHVPQAGALTNLRKNAITRV